MFEELINKKKSIAVIGLGYVGLPLALEFARKYKVIGFDIKPERIKLLKDRIDPSKELKPEEFDNTDISFTSDIDDLKKASFYIVAVPTPINEYNNPDLKPLLGATKTVSSVLKKGDYVIYESTVYPGCTEEDCVPVLENISGLKFQRDFKVGYSPERINPGDKEHTLTKILKIVSGCDPESLEEIAKVYGEIIKAGIHKASSIKVAEAAKIIENTQRDVNIGLMNELSIIFSKMCINTFDVLEAAGTKWNFLKFSPGLVGGHCIGVDPYYLTYKSSKLGYHAQVINSGRYVNDSMGGYIAKQAIKMLISADKEIKPAKALIMGITFKENVSDIRNSKVVDIYKELKSYGLQNIDVIDPYADDLEVEAEYGIKMSKKPDKNYDLIISAVAHKEYSLLTNEDFKRLGKSNFVFIDIKGIFKNKVNSNIYWSL
jgi:UDP-N-acetyl-D-glucosamine/UDP-N-acetyl-D-galactosamine dehydrogenase